MQILKKLLQLVWSTLTWFPHSHISDIDKEGYMVKSVGDVPNATKDIVKELASKLDLTLAGIKSSMGK